MRCCTTFFTKFLLKFQNLSFFVDNPAVPWSLTWMSNYQAFTVHEIFFPRKWKIQTNRGRQNYNGYPPTRTNHENTDRTLLLPSSSNCFQNRLNGRVNAGVTSCQPNASCWSVKSSTVLHWQLFDKL